MAGTNTVAQVLRGKGHDVFSVAPDDSMFAALETMASRDVGALVVLDGGRLVGIVSERDYARKVILLGRASRDTPVRDVMSADVVTVDPTATMQDCMERMTRHRIRHLPVLDEGRVVGLISIGDVVKATIAEQAFLIEQLERYIHGQAM